MKDGDWCNCKVCGGDIRAVVKKDYIGGDEYIVNDYWWLHLQHPEDGHEAEPIHPSEPQ